MTQPARVAVIAPRRGDNLCDQLGKLLSRQSHPLEVGNESLQILPLCILDENVEEPEDGGNGGPEFLPQKGGGRTLETAAAHDRSPARARSASIFCNSRGNSTGLVS